MSLGEGDVSFVLTAVNEDPTAQTTVVEVAGPGGRIDDGGVPDRSETGEVSLMVPARAGDVVRPGTYRVILASENRGDLDVTVLVKSGAVSADTTQVLDVNVWLALSDPAAGSADFRAYLEAGLRVEMDQLLEPHDLRVGDITFSVAGPDDLASFSSVNANEVTDVCDAIAADVGRTRAVNVGFVDRVFDADGLRVGGTSSGLPGAPLVAAADDTCVLVARSARSGVAQHGVTILHESLHFMGLPHTDEPTNLLYGGSVGEPTPVHLSAEQAWLVRRHPLLSAGLQEAGQTLP